MVVVIGHVKSPVVGTLEGLLQMGQVLVGVVQVHWGVSRMVAEVRRKLEHEGGGGGGGCGWEGRCRGL